jgi:hypothetical protein
MEFLGVSRDPFHGIPGLESVCGKLGGGLGDLRTILPPEASEHQFSMKLHLGISSVLAAALLTMPSLNACTACFGKTDEALAQGMNAGIYVMLGFVVAAWVLFGSFFVFIARRSKRVNAETEAGESPSV